MKVLLQRVNRAEVAVAAEVVAKINKGLLLFVGVERADTSATLAKMVDKVLGYRIFADAEGKMNLNVQDAGGGVLAVSQFTLAAQTQKGLRPGFSKAAPPQLARELYQEFVQTLKRRHQLVESGIFAADMQVTLTNDGPVTFLLEL